MKTLVEFFVGNFPSPREFLLYGPPALVWAFCALALSGWLKRTCGWRTGYTRKTFHFIVFFTAAGLQVTGGTRSVCLFGAMVTAVLAYAVWRGKGYSLYESIAREGDEPHRTLYIVVPYLATLVGGVVSTILFGPIAIIGFLVTGVGDAVGEPVGVRFGTHRYRVISLLGVSCTRSVEGSTAVFVASALAVLLGIVATTESSPSVHVFGIAVAVALICTVCEAIAPHGWDNLILQIVPSWLIYAAALSPA